MPKCLMCKEQGKDRNISYRHLSMHNVTTDWYKKKYNVQAILPNHSKAVSLSNTKTKKGKKFKEKHTHNKDTREFMRLIKLCKYEALSKQQLSAETGYSISSINLLISKYPELFEKQQSYKRGSENYRYTINPEKLYLKMDTYFNSQRKELEESIKIYRTKEFREILHSMYHDKTITEIIKWQDDERKKKGLPPVDKKKVSVSFNLYVRKKWGIIKKEVGKKRVYRFTDINLFIKNLVEQTKIDLVWLEHLHKNAYKEFHEVAKKRKYKL